MVEWLRYHWLVRRRAKRMLREYVAEVGVGEEHDVVIDVTDDADQHGKVRAAS